MQSKSTTDKIDKNLPNFTFNQNRNAIHLRVCNNVGVLLYVF